ncbi:aspartyl-phosphate phosphatase Spo0E family protein [Anaeromicrobium sediminis]|uniref:Spo0E family sporulation regulatory protein-aspartic acid phosphatase n=1 Tax=Anaeromicrobium sediminis TaxID=1478221 RepID=A0A267MJ47_9FIRM|nr:aspartyl-phosphate phosphatase Spo0E family protein [Anaeromicrobium sediminis]PAB58820.1 hypothetical protein CCE28_13060 [Anaeromicrobium sediminis]
MSKRDIENLRYKLYNLIENKSSYDEIYKASTDLDKLIVSYYRK